MTTWGVHQVAAWASSSGWKGDELHKAVSVAMATSAGQDAYKVNPSYAPELERRGLWGVRPLDAPEVDAGDLFDPVQNAAFAFAAWDARGQHWAWHPAGLNGAADAALDYVRAVLTGTGRRRFQGAVLPWAESLARAVAAHDAMLHAVPGR